MQTTAIQVQGQTIAGAQPQQLAPASGNHQLPHGCWATAA